MRYRQFFVDGAPTDRVDATEGEFGVPESSGIAEVAALLGVSESAVTAREVDAPVAASTVIPPTEHEPEPLSKVDALLEAIASAKDLGELKASVVDLRERVAAGLVADR